MFLNRLMKQSVFYILLFALLTSCSTFAAPPTSTSTPLPTLIPTDLPSLVPSPMASATPVPVLERATYVLNTTIDYAAHNVTVDETIVYPNRTGQALTSLVLAVVPNLWANCFTLSSVAINDTPTTAFTISPQRMDLTLPAPLGPDQIVKLSIQYSLALPFAEQVDPSVSRPRIFGYTKEQMNLTNWYPFVVPFINGNWVLHDPWYYGENLVYDAADYEVDLKFADPAHAPVVASSGEASPNGDSTRYTLTAGRAFVMSISPDFQVASQQIGDITVYSYYFPLSKNSGQAVLTTTIQAIQVYTQHYGPYPHKTLSAVMGDFNDGMEYSAFFYLSRDFYNLYNSASSPVNYLITVTAHETAHQWWFEQVASDQAEQPWLDEALATYSERVFYESIYPNLVPEWWAYRVDFYQPQGFVDIPIYSGGGFRPYTNAVYFRGAHFLEDLRHRIGDDVFFAFLQDYLKQEEGKIATSSDFFRILNEHTKTNYSDLVLHYFQNVY